MKKKFLPAAHKLSYNDKKTLENLAYDIRYIRNKDKLGGGLFLMASEHESLGIHAYFGDKDIASMKQHFHVAAKLNVASAGLRWGETLSTGASLVYVLLSDSSEVIQSYARLEPNDEFIKQRENPKALQFYVHMTQLAIRDEQDALRVKISIAAQKSGKKLREEFASGQDFFSLLLNRDKKMLEELITRKANEWQAIIKRGSATGNPLSERFLASIATEYAKICWLKGIEVEIEHPLVPMELLPVKPLDHYDDIYDFLASDWVPPKPSFLQRIKHLFTR